MSSTSKNKEVNELNAADQKVKRNWENTCKVRYKALEDKLLYAKVYSRLGFKNSFIIHKPIDLSNGRKYITCSDFISIKPPLISMRCFIRYNVTARDLMNIGYQHSNWHKKWWANI